MVEESEIMKKSFWCRCGQRFRHQAEFIQHRDSCEVVKVGQPPVTNNIPSSPWLPKQDSTSTALLNKKPTQPSLFSAHKRWWEHEGNKTLKGEMCSYENEERATYKPHAHANWMKVGPYQIMGCSLHSTGMVGIGIMLDSGWLKSGMILVGGRSRVGTPKGWVYVHWPDRNVIPLASYRKLIEHIVGQLKAGKQVSVGCFGGHGRTGTVLAGVLAMLEGLNGAEAIKEVRKRYCDRAVETEEQEILITKFRDRKENRK